MSSGWLVWALIAIFGAALLGRRCTTQRGKPRPRALEPLKSGERYDTAVKLTTVANAPLADLWVQRLREEGIEAFFKSGALASMPGIYGGPAVNPGGPVELWVGQHGATRARELFPELA